MTATAIGSYATTAALKSLIGTTDSNDDTLIGLICDRVNSYIEDVTGRVMAPIASAIYLLDGDGTDRLYFPRGIRAMVRPPGLIACREFNRADLPEQIQQIALASGQDGNAAHGAHTPDSRALAIVRRSTRISMKARSNLYRQASEACASFCVGTEMILDTVVTVTSAPRSCSSLDR